MSTSDLHMHVYTLAYTLTCMSRKTYTHKTFHKHKVFLKVNDFLVQAWVRSHDISLHVCKYILHPKHPQSKALLVPPRWVTNSTLIWLNIVFFKHNVTLYGQTR